MISWETIVEWDKLRRINVIIAGSYSYPTVGYIKKNLLNGLNIPDFDIYATHRRKKCLILKNIGKTHIASACGYQACLKSHTVLFSSAIDIVNNLITARHAGTLKQELKKHLKPGLLLMDDSGFLPIDKTGTDLLFQIISQRYEQGSIIITANRVFKDRPQIFNNNTTLTSALLK